MYTTCIFTLLICLICCVGCQDATQPAGSPSKVVEREDDQRYARLASGALDNGDKAAEARAWLDAKNTTNVLWKTSRGQTMQFVNDLYQAGAVKVYAIYAPRDGTIPVNLCAELFLELPTDKEKRRNVIKTYNRIEAELWGPDASKERDQGQKYLNLNMDP